jgi:hypothetical protein
MQIPEGLVGVLSTPLVLAGLVAGTALALLVALTVVAARRVGFGALPRMLVPLAALVIAAIGISVVSDRLRMADRDAERRALLARDAALDAAAMAPGSALACLDARVGEAVENACERMVFATPQSAAAAVAYMDARLKLLADAAAHDRSVLAMLASTRRAVALDRFGVAAHVLAVRDGCTADKCPAFALVDDASALKANLSAQVYDQYVSRYVADWSAEPKAEKPAPVSALSEPGSVAGIGMPGGAAPVVPAVKPGEHWDFPSAASIPPVSIMNAEPPLPKGAEAQARANGTAKEAVEGKAPDLPKHPPPPAPKPAAR